MYCRFVKSCAVPSIPAVDALPYRVNTKPTIQAISVVNLVLFIAIHPIVAMNSPVASGGELIPERFKKVFWIALMHPFSVLCCQVTLLMRLSPIMNFRWI